jgi:hypothetical protein
LTKAEVYSARYENFRKGVSAECRFIDSSCRDLFDGATFAFVCVDKGSSRAGIFDLLISKGIPFIDVGMGLNRKKGPTERNVAYNLLLGRAWPEGAREGACRANSHS